MKIGPWEYTNRAAAAADVKSAKGWTHSRRDGRDGLGGFEDGELQAQLEYETWVRDPGAPATAPPHKADAPPSPVTAHGHTAASSLPSVGPGPGHMPLWLQKERQEAIAAHDRARDDYVRHQAQPPFRSTRTFGGGNGNAADWVGSNDGTRTSTVAGRGRAFSDVNSWSASQPERDRDRDRDGGGKRGKGGESVRGSVDAVPEPFSTHPTREPPPPPPPPLHAPSATRSTARGAPDETLSDVSTPSGSRGQQGHGQKQGPGHEQGRAGATSPLGFASLWNANVA